MVRVAVFPVSFARAYAGAQHPACTGRGGYARLAFRRRRGSLAARAALATLAAGEWPRPPYFAALARSNAQVQGVFRERSPSSPHRRGAFPCRRPGGRCGQIGGGGRNRAVHRPVPQGGHRLPRRSGRCRHPRQADRAGRAGQAARGHRGIALRARAAHPGAEGCRGRRPGQGPPGGHLPAAPAQAPHAGHAGAGKRPGTAGRSAYGPKGARPQNPGAGLCERGQGRARRGRRPCRRAGHHRRGRGRGPAPAGRCARPVRPAGALRLQGAQGQGAGRGHLSRLVRLGRAPAEHSRPPRPGHVSGRGRGLFDPFPAPARRRAF